MTFQRLYRFVMACVLLLVGYSFQAAWGQTITIAAPARSVALPSLVPAFNLPLKGNLDPEAIWQQLQPVAQPVNAEGRWNVNSEQRTAAKFTLSTKIDHIFTLEVPLVRIDRVDVFWRAPGKTWSHAEAGDTVALSRWPIVGQFPTFVLHVDDVPGTLDVVMVMQNAGLGSTLVSVNSDRESRERRMLQANAAGLLIGASTMVLLVVVLLCLVYRNVAGLYLLAYCTAITLGTAILNGYAAIWFTGESPLFNDGSKPIAASVMSAAMMCASIAALDRSVVSRRWRRIALGTLVLIVGYTVAQATLLQPEWRLVGGTVVAATVILLTFSISLINWRRDDRYAPWVMLSTVLFAGSAVVVAKGYVQLLGIDFFAALMALLLIASSLVLRHVLIMRERFGRAVLGRAEINRYRDPLTALLSYEGFENAVENLAVRQHSGGGVAHVLYFSLTQLDSFRQEDGYVVWQRDLVRFAAVLQKVLGEGWHIARLSNSKFGAVRLDEQRETVSDRLLTLVLSSCARKIDTKDWIDRVGLRMAAVNTPLTSSGLKESMRVLEQSVRDLEPGKRIALL
jgi:GGDEF domain-containing protein